MCINYCRTEGRLLDLAMIGSMWRGAADRIDGLVADHKVDVGAIRAERI